MALQIASSRLMISQVLSGLRFPFQTKRMFSFSSTTNSPVSVMKDLILYNHNARVSVGLFHSSLLARPSLSLHRGSEINPHEKRSYSTNASPDNQVPPQPQPSSSTFDDVEPDMYQQSSSIRRRPYNLEAKMRMKQYRREAMQRQRAQEIEDEERNFQLDYSKLYKKGDPGTVQGIVKDIITVGYFMKLPNGREGFLPCSQFGCSGGIPLLTRIFKVGDEITVRAEIVGDGGKDKLYCRDCEKWA